MSVGEFGECLRMAMPYCGWRTDLGWIDVVICRSIRGPFFVDTRTSPVRVIPSYCQDRHGLACAHVTTAVSHLLTCRPSIVRQFLFDSRNGHSGLPGGSLRAGDLPNSKSEIFRLRAGQNFSSVNP